MNGEKKILGGGRVGGGGCQGVCERRIEVFVKIQKKKWRGPGSGRGGGGWGRGGQGLCERRNEVFVKIQKKWRGGGSGRGDRVGGGGSGWMWTKN